MSGIPRTTTQPVLPVLASSPHDASDEIRILFQNDDSISRYLLSQQQSIAGLYDILARTINRRHLVGVAAEQPTAGDAGQQYFTTDTTPKSLAIDDGSSWQSLPAWAVPLATTLGGTGLTSYTTGDLLYASATNVLSKLAKGTSGYVLQQGASVPAWFNLFGTANTWTGAQTLYSSGVLINNPANTFAYTITASAITAARTLTLPLTRQAETLAVRPTLAVTLPGSPTGTTSAGGVMMGLAVAFTPMVTGRAFMAISGYAHNTTAGAMWWVETRYGTGTAPVNGAALTGSIAGALQIGTSSVASEDGPFCMVGLPTALTIGTAYWIDVALYAIGGGTATIWQPSVVVCEL